MIQPAIRMKEQIGIVTNDTSTKQLSFLISPLKNKTTVEEKEYILFDHPTNGETSQILAEVTEIRSYEEIGGTSLTDKTAGNRIATAQILGYINLQDENRPLHKLLTPPNPGSRIYLPYNEFLTDTLKRDNDGKPYQTPISIGTTQTTALTITNENKQPIQIHLDAQTITRTHTLITATDGTGKTHTAKLIAKEIREKTQTPIIIMDPYNEYKQNTSSLAQTVTPNPDKNPKDATKHVKPNQTTILTAEGLTPKEKQNLYHQHLTQLWKARQEKSVPPLLLIAEDAETLKGETLDEIAYAGTKNGIALILITKHPAELGGKILSQTTAQIMGRTTDKTDLDYLANVAGEKAALLPSLTRGQWIISSATMTLPVQMQIHEQ
jgi:DNA helicase HerA-like ATPase